MPAKISSSAKIASASEALTTAPVVATACVFTLPLESVVIKHDVSVKADRPKVIIKSATRADSVGTLSIFGPNYLSYDQQRAFLLDLFEHNDSFDGSDFQPTFNADGTADGFFFESYGQDSPTFEVISAEAALKRMKTTGLNCAPMVFGTPNTKLSRGQIQDATDMARGNYAKILARKDGIMDVIGSIFK